MGGGEIIVSTELRVQRVTSVCVLQGVTTHGSPLLHVFSFCLSDTLLSAPLNVTITEIDVNSALVTWETLEGDPVIGFAITQQVPLYIPTYHSLMFL